MVPLMLWTSAWVKTLQHIKRWAQANLQWNGEERGKEGDKERGKEGRGGKGWEV
jgi:hypothetical protein